MVEEATDDLEKALQAAQRKNHDLRRRMARMREVEEQSVLTRLRHDIQTGNVPLDQVTWIFIAWDFIVVMMNLSRIIRAEWINYSC